jgi:hypothetical protein
MTREMAAKDIAKRLFRGVLSIRVGTAKPAGRCIVRGHAEPPVMPNSTPLRKRVCIRLTYRADAGFQSIAAFTFGEKDDDFTTQRVAY